MPIPFGCIYTECTSSSTMTHFDYAGRGITSVRCPIPSWSKSGSFLFGASPGSATPQEPGRRNDSRYPLRATPIIHVEPLAAIIFHGLSSLLMVSCLGKRFSRGVILVHGEAHESPFLRPRHRSSRTAPARTSHARRLRGADRRLAPRSAHSADARRHRPPPQAGRAGWLAPPYPPSRAATDP